jgi:hypothetical protein
MSMTATVASSTVSGALFYYGADSGSWRIVRQFKTEDIWQKVLNEEEIK